MLRTELAARIAVQHGLTREQATAVVAVIFDTVAQRLVEGGRVELRGFGVFEPRRKRAREGQSPYDGRHYSLPDRVSLAFYASRVMVRRLNGEIRERDARRRAASRDRPD